MPLARLENFLKNLNGNTLYVDPNELDASDSIENRGNSRIRPFKTIQRALIEAARFSYIPGPNNDLFDQTTILISPGTHFIDNRPGFYVDQNQILRDANNSSRTISELNISSNFDLDDPSNILYAFNSADGGVILPKGTSIVSTDLRKTKIKPKFVPNPINDLIAPAAIFRLTGACYIYGFTIFDGDPVGKVYSNYTTNTSVPNYSHHKLTAFEYADDSNTLVRNGVDTGYTDLEAYYYKLSLAYGAQSGRSIIDGFSNFQPNVDENRIVGELGLGSISIVSAVSGNGTSGTNVITIQTQTPHGLSPLTPILLSGLGQDEGPTSELEYNGNFIVAQVTSETEFTYLLSNVPTQTLNPSVSGATVKVISDTVSSASPYIYNCSLKSVYGMNGIHADGSKVSGFKSVVTAQFTGISLQKDDRAFVEYEESVGGYNYQENYGVDKFLHQSSRAKYRPSWESFHVKASNNSFIQCVSIFAIGYAKQFVSESGGDQSITNSNSNFGSISLFSTGFKDIVLAKDNHAFITHIIPPKDISSIESDVRYVDIDATLTSSNAPSNQNTRVYLKGYIDLLDPPPNNVRNFVIGGKQNDTISFKRANEQYSIPVSPSYKSEYDVTGIDTDTNIITLSSVSGISTGLSGKIISGTGELPDGIIADKLYNVRLTGGTGVRLYSNSLNAETNTAPIDIKNSVGLTTSNLKFISRISEKNSGDVGSPVQWDETAQNWYVGVNSVGAGATDFFLNLIGVTAPGSFFTRKVDSRFNKDKLYRVRIVIPKESENSSDLSSGFIIQKASNALDSALYQADSEQLVSSNPINQVRNDGAIADAWYSSGTVTIVTSKPHKLNVGDTIEIYNLKSTNEPDPVGLGTGTGYNGKFTVASVINEIRFTYSISRNPGTITLGTSAVATWLTERDCAQTSNYRVPPYTIYDVNRTNLPYFVNKKIINDYQLYDIETIQEYVEGTTDGIYHVILNAFKNTPNIVPFNTEEYKLSQSIEKLYPTQDLDNPIADPEGTISLASRKEIGTVLVNDVKKSVTKETLASYLKDFNLTSKISGITTYYDSGSGIGTVTTSIPHGLGGIRRLTVTTAGSGYVNGLFYDVPLCGGSGSNATANIRVAANVVAEASIQNQGSGYVSGDLLRVRGIPGSTNDCFLTVSSVNYSESDTDTLQIIGCTKEQNNGTFVIKSVTSNTITYYNNDATAENPTNAVAFLSGIGYQIRNSPDGSVYNNITDVTTITTQQPHSFSVGSKVIFDDAIGNPLEKIGISTVSTVTGITTFTVKGDASSAIRVFGAGLLSNPKDTSSTNENLNSRHFTILGGYKGAISQQISASVSNFLINDLYGLDKGDFIQINSEIMLITRISGGEIYVKRALFGTRAVPHENNSSIKKIKIVPIELRRNSIIRASGHTFEYTGFGPGNYSTGMPTNQDRILSDTEVLTSQSLNTRGGLVVYTGMNSDGEFYIGKTKFDAITGKQIDVGLPEAESSNAATLDVIVANKVIINDELDATTAAANINRLTVTTDAFVIGITTVASVTNTTDPSNGALVVLGGVGIDKSVNIGENLTVLGTAGISSIKIGIASASTIDTFSENLYLNSAGGNTIVNDNLHVSGNIRVAGVSTFVSNVSAGASITSVGDIVAGSSAVFKGYGTIPINGIIMWSGSVETIPSGWALCDGTSGTPDLRERFIVGAGGDNPAVAGTVGYTPGTQGGLNEVILTSSQIPAHTHTATGITTTTVSPASVLTSLTTTSSSFSTGVFGSTAITGITQNSSSTSATSTTTITVANNTGGGGSHENRPPYYALAFIMRTL
jgi:microcystin-dependent protein